MEAPCSWPWCRPGTRNLSMMEGDPQHATKPPPSVCCSLSVCCWPAKGSQSRLRRGCCKQMLRAACTIELLPRVGAPCRPPRACSWRAAAARALWISQLYCYIYSIMGDLLSLGFSPGLGLLSFLQPCTQARRKQGQHQRESTNLAAASGLGVWYGPGTAMQGASMFHTAAVNHKDAAACRSQACRATMLHGSSS